MAERLAGATGARYGCAGVVRPEGFRLKCVLAICAALLLCVGPASAQFVPNSVANGKPCRGPATGASEACVSKTCAPGPTINVAGAGDLHYCLAPGRKCAWPGSGGEDFGVQGRREGVDYYCCDPKLFGYDGAALQFWPVKCRRADGGPLPPGSAAPAVAAKAPTPPAQKAKTLSPQPPPAARAPGAPLPLTR